MGVPLLLLPLLPEHRDLLGWRHEQPLCLSGVLGLSRHEGSFARRAHDADVAFGEGGRLMGPGLGSRVWLRAGVLLCP